MVSIKYLIYKSYLVNIDISFFKIGNFDLFDTI